MLAWDTRASDSPAHHPFGQESIHFKNHYHRLSNEKLDGMFRDSSRPPWSQGLPLSAGFLLRKFAADFSIEMTRSVRQMIESWTAE